MLRMDFNLQTNIKLLSVLLALEEEPWNGTLLIIWSLIYCSCLNVCIDKVFDL